MLVQHAGNGPFMTGKVENMCQRCTLLGCGGVVRDMVGAKFSERPSYTMLICCCSL